MNIHIIEKNGVKVAVISDCYISDVSSALAVMATVSYEHDAHRIAADKELFCNEFFVLSSGVAGEILQKYTNYGVKLAVYGDFSAYNSKPLKDFIYESNKGSSVFFVSSEDEAVLRLAEV